MGSSVSELVEDCREVRSINIQARGSDGSASVSVCIDIKGVEFINARASGYLPPGKVGNRIIAIVDVGLKLDDIAKVQTNNIETVH